MTQPPYPPPPPPPFLCRFLTAIFQRLLLPLLAKHDGRYDALFLPGLVLVARSQNFSISFLQRHLCIGYSRACRIMAAIEATQLVKRETAKTK